MLEFYDTIGNEILILVGGSRAIVCRRDISNRKIQSRLPAIFRYVFHV